MGSEMKYREPERDMPDQADTDCSQGVALEALREAELRYRIVADFTFDWEYWEAPDGKLRYVSPSCARITGYSPQDFLANPHLLNNLILPQDRAVWTEHRRAVACLEPCETQFRIRARDGGIRWIEHVCQPVTDERGSFLGHRASNRDITQRKRVEDELREVRAGLEELVAERTAELADANRALRSQIAERKRTEEAFGRSEERYALAQRVANIGSWDWDIQTGALYWSERIEPMFGFERGKFGATYEAFLECVHPQDRQFVEDSVNASVEEAVDYAIEHRIVWPDGTVRWVSETGDVIRDRDGRALRMVGIVQDITARRQAAQALRQAKEVAESLGDVLAILNSNQPLDEVLDYIAAQAGQLLGTQAACIYSMEEGSKELSARAMRGRLADDVVGNKILMGHQGVQQAMASRQPMAVSELADLASGHDLTPPSEYGAADNDWRRARGAFLAVPIVVQEKVYGGLLLYYGEPRNFSEEEIELAVAYSDQVALAIGNAQLREQVEETAMSAERHRLARELHDAVTQTLFSASLIAEAMPRVWEHDPDEGRRGLEELRRLTRGAAAEMRTMLVELRPAALTEKPLGELVRHLTEAMAGRARVAMDLNLDGDCTLPPDVQIALYRIIQEALNNSAKHAGASRVSVDLYWRPQQAALEISDDGCGFDVADVLPDRLGLGIMRERAQDIGALLDITSQPGHGTRITVKWQTRGEVTA
jgi:PAS domain S-box-containing protein